MDFWRRGGTILSIPTYRVLVLQGLVGGLPWQAISFVNMYWLTVGFSDSQAAWITSIGHSGAIVGVLCGGFLADALALRWGPRGRVCVAQASVLLGIPFWYWMLTPSLVMTRSAAPLPGSTGPPTPVQQPHMALRQRSSKQACLRFLPAY